MRKKIVTLVCVLLLLVSAALPVHAAGVSDRLVDQADLLTDSEEAVLAARLDEIRRRQGMDVVIVTVYGTGGKSATAYADDYYDENGFGEDGLLLLIDMWEREWAISTAGYAITVFTDAGLDYMAERFLDDLSEGAYSDAFHTFADLTDSFITQAETDAPFDVENLPRAPFNAVLTLLICLAVGLVAALIVTGVMWSQLKNVHPQAAAAHYVKDGSMHITHSRDIFLYRNVSRERIESSDSGGSSTHVSSSGRIHGGRSGKF